MLYSLSYNEAPVFFHSVFTMLQEMMLPESWRIHHHPFRFFTRNRKGDLSRYDVSYHSYVPPPLTGKPRNQGGDSGAAKSIGFQISMSAFYRSCNNAFNDALLHYEIEDDKRKGCKYQHREEACPVCCKRSDVLVYLLKKYTFLRGLQK